MHEYTLIKGFRFVFHALIPSRIHSLSVLCTPMTTSMSSKRMSTSRSREIRRFARNSEEDAEEGRRCTSSDQRQSISWPLRARLVDGA